MHSTSAALERSAPRLDSARAARVVADLLRASLQNLDSNREEATRLISTACSVLETTGGPAPGEQPVRGGLAPWQIRKIKAYVDANIGQPISVAYLSTLVGRGQSHLQRAFKKSFGVTPRAFILERRIQHAQTLMLKTEESLCAIARAAGFSDQSHLSTRFRRALGVTPSIWRRERRGDDGLVGT